MSPLPNNIRWDPCKVCGDTTFNLGTQLCDRCWELKIRIEERPQIAIKFLTWGGHLDHLLKAADDASRLRNPDTTGQ